MTTLKVGDMAPDFTLPSTIGDKVPLSDYRGKKNVLLLFYPLDFSPTYPLLAEFHPKGDISRKYGVYLEDKGLSARTAFIIGKDGRIRDVVGSEIPVARDIGKLIEKTRAA
jgi:peroxiredoxin